MKLTLVCVAPGLLSQDFVTKVTEILEQLSVSNLKLEQSTSQKIVLTFEGQLEELKAPLKALSIVFKVDYALMPQKLFETPKKLVLFDMDSTLIQAEVIDEMAKIYGVGEQVQSITKRAMNGELNFDQSLMERLSLLKGLTKKQLEEIHARMPLSPGVPEFMAIAHKHGIKTAIVSGGFQFFADPLKKDLGMNYAYANQLEFDGDKLTGKSVGAIVNAQRKLDLLVTLAQQEQVPFDQVVAVGDGANDIPMLLKAGLGIAYHAKEKVKEATAYHLEYGPMTTILSFMGLEG